MSSSTGPDTSTNFSNQLADETSSIKQGESLLLSLVAAIIFNEGIPNTITKAPMNSSITVRKSMTTTKP